METKEKVKIRIEQPFVLTKGCERIEIDFIEFEDELLRIDFVVAPDLRYTHNWWCRIERSTFIRPVGSSLKLKMVKTDGIDIAPGKTYFPHKNCRLKFSLYFPLPPQGTEHIDIIEKEFAGNGYFNFYGVAMSKVLNQQIYIGNTISPN